MFHLFRKYQQQLMIAVTVVVIITFVWLYNGTRLDRLGGDQAFRVYGKTLSQTDIDRVVRRYQVAQALHLSLVYGLGGGAGGNQGLENFVWNSYVLTHESKEFGIEPTDEQVKSALMGLAVFQTSGQFDPVKYQNFVQNMLAPNGFTDDQLEALVRDDLRLNRLTDLVGSTVDVTPAEFRLAYVQNYQKMDVSLVRFDLSGFAAAVTPKEEEIKKYYDTHQETLTTDEKRVVSFVRITLNDQEKKLTGKDRVAALSKQTAKATDFGQALLAGNGATFESVAKQFGLKVETTPEFTEADPAPDLAAVPQAAVTAFRLTTKEPDSDPVEVGTGFYLLHLDKVVPKRPLTAEEARPRIVEAIKDEQGHQALVSKANEVRSKIADALKAGKSFPDAVAAAGAKVESFPAFSIAEPPSGKPDAAEIVEKAVELGDGGLSELVSTANGGLLIHLDKREPVDEAKLAKAQETQLETVRNFKRLYTFHDWLGLQLKAANVQSLRPAREKNEG